MSRTPLTSIVCLLYLLGIAQAGVPAARGSLARPWEFKFDDELTALIRAEIAGRPCIVTGTDGGVVRLHAADGVECWRAKVPFPVSKLCATETGDGAPVLACSAQGHVAALSAEGEIRWSQKLPGEIVALTPVPGSEGDTHGFSVACNDGAVYWLDTSGDVVLRGHVGRPITGGIVVGSGRDATQVVRTKEMMIGLTFPWPPLPPEPRVPPADEGACVIGIGSGQFLVLGLTGKPLRFPAPTDWSLKRDSWRGIEAGTFRRDEEVLRVAPIAPDTSSIECSDEMLTIHAGAQQPVCIITAGDRIPREHVVKALARAGQLRNSGATVKSMPSFDAILYKATKQEEWLAIDLDIAESGRHEIWLEFLKYRDRGTYRAQLDGQALADNMDLWSAGVVRKSVCLGARQLTVGKHELRLTSVGKHPENAESKFFLGLCGWAAVPCVPPVIRIDRLGSGLHLVWQDAQIIREAFVASKPGVRTTVRDVASDAQAWSLVRAGQTVVSWELRRGTFLRVSGRVLARLPLASSACGYPAD